MEIMRQDGKWPRYVPHVVVFLSSMGVMIIELVASRLVSKYFGNSLYTWTGVIGVILGGISLGNWIGGRLADRHPPRRLIAPLLLAASLLVLLILGLDLLLHALLTSGPSAASAVTAGMVLQSVVVITVLFLLPAASLGTISPVMARAALLDSDRVGNTVGSIYALSAIGSIAGTFLSGFVLIPLLGLTTIILVVALLMAALALVTGGLRLLGGAWTAGIVLLLVLTRAWLSPAAPSAPAGEETVNLWQGESMYSHIEVREERRAGRTERMLILDGLIHNRWNPDDPDELLYEYEAIFAALVERTAGGAAGRGAAGGGAAREGDAPGDAVPLSTLTLGGGACVFPFYLERRYPGSFNRIVEIDPEVIRVARRWFGVTDSARTPITLLDARRYVDGADPSRPHQLIFLDAFSSYSIPYHLTTREFTERAAGLLAPGGLFVVNAIDVLSIGRFLNAYLNTLRAVFPQVAVYGTPGTSPDRRATFVLVAARSGQAVRALPAVLADPSGRTVAEKLPDGALEELKRRNGPGLLTDGYAPVESLIAPVFLHSIARR